jgi:hypothetical protein
VAPRQSPTLQDGSSLTRQEEFVLKQAASGEIADLKQEFGAAEERRRLRALFLEELLTGELPGVEVHRRGVRIIQAVVEEFLTDGRMKVVSLEDADLALRGKITKYEAIQLSYNPQSYVQQYRVHLVVEAVLEDLRSKKILWRERGIESNLISDYAVSYDPAGKTDITLTKISKDAAIKNASKDIAQTLRSRVLEGF